MNKPLTAPITKGAHHIGLTVPDLGQTRRFFADTLGYETVGEIPEYPAVFLSDGTTMVTLWQAENPATAVAFDRKNVIGLHHLAIAIEGQESLDVLYEWVRAAADVTIEFAPEPLNGGPARHMMCAIPGGIRVEFIAA